MTYFFRLSGSAGYVQNLVQVVYVEYAYAYKPQPGHY